MQVKEYFLDISDELFAYAFFLSKDERQALGIFLDSVEALFIEKSSLLSDFLIDPQNYFFRRAIKKVLLGSIYRISNSRSFDRVLEKSVLFFQHKGTLDKKEIPGVLAISRNDFITILNGERDKILEGEYKISNIDVCRLSRNTLSQFDLGQRDEKWENHLQSCSPCQERLAEMNALLLRIDEKVEYQQMSTHFRQEIEGVLDVIMLSNSEAGSSGHAENGKVFIKAVFSKKMIIFYLGTIAVVMIIRFLL